MMNSDLQGDEDRRARLGFILAPCHHIQPDTPLENVLALYDVVAERRGGSIRQGA